MVATFPPKIERDFRKLEKRRGLYIEKGLGRSFEYSNVYDGTGGRFRGSQRKRRLRRNEASQLWGHVLDVRRDVPLMAEDVLHRRRAVPVGLVGRLLDDVAPAATARRYAESTSGTRDRTSSSWADRDREPRPFPDASLRFSASHDGPLHLARCTSRISAPKARFRKLITGSARRGCR